MATAQQACIVNGVNVDGLTATVEAVKATPSIASFRFRVNNQWKGGGRNSTVVGGFYGAQKEQTRLQSFILEADEPAVLLGRDSAANPVEHLLHALASCLTTSMVYHAAARGIEIAAIESSFEGDIDLHGFLDLDPNVRTGYQGIRVNFKVKADVPDEQIEEIVRLGTRFSPVFDSIRNGVPVAVRSERL